MGIISGILGTLVNGVITYFLLKAVVAIVLVVLFCWIIIKLITGVGKSISRKKREREQEERMYGEQS